MPDETARSTIELAAEIISAFVSHNAVPLADLANLIGNVHAALQNTGHPVQQQDEAKPIPAVSVKKSITPDFLISLEDGKQYRSLKRHLGKLGLTPDEYRAKWGLPDNYPMVAPSYAKMRSELAKSMGLGQQRSQAARAKAAARDGVKTAPAKAPAKRGRKKTA